MLGPQSFSYGTLGNNNKIYIPPYGLSKIHRFMIKLDPETWEITKIPVKTDDSTEKWQRGIVINDYIYWLPYNESSILGINTKTDETFNINLYVQGYGKYLVGHVYGDEIISMPYGEHEPYNWALVFNYKTHDVDFVKIDCPINSEKKWHTTQLLNGTIYGLPRGENWEEYFPYRIEFNCDNKTYQLIDMSDWWQDIDKQEMANKKFTTLAKYKDKLFAPPWSENNNFDVLAKFINGKWTYERTGLTYTSRKYFTYNISKDGKIYFPPAGHEEDWSHMLIIDGETNKWWTVDLEIGKESKKYFAGKQNSEGKIYYIPRGGCVCEPKHTWKTFGDLAEILVIDTNTDEFYTIDIGEYFTDNTTIEKYNDCVIYNDIIFAFPYGESDSFQTILVFDTKTEKMLGTIDLNDRL